MLAAAGGTLDEVVLLSIGMADYDQVSTTGLADIEASGMGGADLAMRGPLFFSAGISGIRSESGATIEDPVTQGGDDGTKSSTSGCRASAPASTIRSK